MELKIFSSNPMGQNVYLYHHNGEGVLIDAGCGAEDKEVIASYLKSGGIAVKGILLTHGHFDHIAAADEMAALVSAELYCHALEKEVLENPELNLSVRFGRKMAVTANEVGEKFAFGGVELKVLHTPGHTPGGVCYYDEANAVLFSGDTLFRESVGRTDFPYGNTRELKESIKNRLFTLPENTSVYPGHGPRTTIGHEKRKNPFVN